MTSRPDRRPPSAEAGRAIALAAGLVIALALAFVDWSARSQEDVLIGGIVLAPLVCALLGRPRDVALVGALATALTIASGLWNDNLGEAAHLLRILVVATGSVVATLAARSRVHVGRDRERFAVLSAVAEIADGTRSLEETMARLEDLVVPAVADLCIVDAVRDGELVRLSVRAAGPGGEQLAAALAARPAAPDGEQAVAPRLAEPVDDELLHSVAADAVALEQLRALRASAAIAVPLRARGRDLGSMTLIVSARSGRRYTQEDLEFAEVLAGRAALALDNAGLFSELQTIEAQLTASLSHLAEAVTVQHAEGALIYANAAAARMLGCSSPQELLATPVQELIERFQSTNEDGSPLRMEELPGRRVLAGEEPGQLVVRTIDKRTGEESWRVTKATGVHDRDGRVRLVVNVIEDITEVKRVEIAQRLLARAGAVLASSLDYERTLQQVAELAVPQLADWCAVSMPDGHGFIRTVAVAHVDPDKVALARRIGERFPSRADAPTGAAQVIRDGTSQLVNEIPDAMLATAAHDEEHLELLRGVGMHAGLTVPMSAGGKNVGTLSLVSAESGRRFSAADVELAEELARRAGTAVENARLYTERSHIARTLQTGLLPGRLPRMPGWSTKTLYRPAGDENWVGGDFYDVFEVHGGWLALVGDVAGRGATAAALTALARHTLRTAATLLDDPLSALGTLNAELRRREQMSLCSVAAVALHERDGLASAEIVCAGHPLPLLIRGGVVSPLGAFAPMLGAYDVDSWERTTVALADGDVLVLYTDGVLDTVGDGGRFGEQRLQAALAGATDATGAVASIDAALSSFEVGEQADDTAVLAVERVAATARSRPVARGRQGTARR